MVSKDIEGMTPEDLRMAKSAVTALKMLGLTEAQIDALPALLSQSQSAEARIAGLEQRVARLERSASPREPVSKSEADEISAIRSASQLDKDVERVNFSAFPGKAGDER